MGEVRDVEALQQGSGQECKSCEGTGFKACEMCMGTGQVQLVVLGVRNKQKVLYWQEFSWHAWDCNSMSGITTVAPHACRWVCQCKIHSHGPLPSA